MDVKKYNLPVGAVLTVLLWAVLTVLLWFAPRQTLSEAERRPLAQMPPVTADSLLDGSFMEKFEDFSLDQFPLRNAFRTLKSLFHYGILGQKDNNAIYIADGFAVKQEYPLNPGSIDHAADRFSYLSEKYLTDARVYFALVPDKGQYLAEKSGHLTLSYREMDALLREKLPWATHIDLLDSLDHEAYYRTDTHWRQEGLLPAAKTICEAMGIAAPEETDYEIKTLERPFYGVYYGQAALPMEPETMAYLESEVLKNCTVYDYESGKTGAVYDMTKLESRDLYDIFLSGARSLLTIENPAGKEGKELIVFRDSFGSSMVPLLVQEYAKVTLVDIRYIQIDVLDRFLEFGNQDVLFLYSTLVMNNSETIK